MKSAFLGLKKTNNKRGQAAIESVLLALVLMGVFIKLTSTIREKQMISKMVAKPMQNIATMSGYGTWKSECSAFGKTAKQTLGKCHPNSIARSLSSDPEP